MAQLPDPKSPYPLHKVTPVPTPDGEVALVMDYDVDANHPRSIAFRLSIDSLGKLIEDLSTWHRQMATPRDGML
jgi:hypothetical protein